MTTADRHRAVEVARTSAGLAVQDLWLRYIALGGSCDAFDVDGYLQGLVPLEEFQQDVLAQTVNEALQDWYRSLRVPLTGAIPVGVGNDALVTVIDQLLARRPTAPDPDTTPPGDAGPPSTRPPRPRPER